MILSDREIQAAIREKNILIDPPPDEALFSSTALDLTLDGVLLRWKETGNHPSGQPIKLCPSREGFDIRAMMHRPALLGQGRDRPPGRLRPGTPQVRPGLHPGENLPAEPVEDCSKGRG